MNAREATSRIVVYASDLTDDIYVGITEKGRNCFLEKRSAKNDVLLQVAKYLTNNYEHDGYIDLEPKDRSGKLPHIKITAEIITQPSDTKEAE
jgi:hypothetical protein